MDVMFKLVMDSWDLNPGRLMMADLPQQYTNIRLFPDTFVEEYQMAKGRPIDIEVHDGPLVDHIVEKMDAAVELTFMCARDKFKSHRFQSSEGRKIRMDPIGKPLAVFVLDTMDSILTFKSTETADLPFAYQMYYSCAMHSVAKISMLLLPLTSV